MLYKNISLTQKTFHGVTFKPGEVKEVPGYINNRGFIPVDEMPQEPPKRVEHKKSEASKQESSKQESSKEKESRTESKNSKKEETVNGSDSDK